jgi:16S rRNA (uracil1498-N3)-methyltransferase
MNGLVLFEHELKDQNEYFIKPDERVQHVLNHLKLNQGDTLSIIELNKGTGRALIKDCHQGLHLEVIERQKTQPSLIQLCVGISRPPTMKKILEHATTMGVGHFHLVTTELSEKSYAQSKVLEEKSMLDLMIKGLAQARTLAHRPQITRYSKLSEFSSPVVKQKILLSPFATTTLNQLNFDFHQELIIAIGPERGLSQKDEEFFIHQGFQRVAIGPNILRVEYAVASILAQIELLKN